MRRILQFARILSVILLVATGGYFAAFKLGWLQAHATVFAAMVLGVCAWMLAELVWAVVKLVRHEGSALAGVGTVVLLAGVLTALGAGAANWAMRLSGFVIIVEGEAAALFYSTHLNEFDAGMFSDVEEMNLVLRLEKVQFMPKADGSFTPKSHLRLIAAGGEQRAFSIMPGTHFQDGTLRFHHGAFGFAPSIVILDGDEKLFERTVPFTTRRDNQHRVSFVGELTVAEHDLRVKGEVGLDTLDARMRGHPRLSLSIERGGELLGSGSLLPGRYADLDGGLRVGFTGLKKWAEIDISRKSYPEPMVAGAGVAALGLLLLAAALVRARLQRRAGDESAAEASS